MNKLGIVIALSLCMAIQPSVSFAATASGVLTVQATVVAACTATSGVLAFGVVDPAAGSSTLRSTNLLVTCTQGTTFSVGLGDGTNGSAGQRRMKGALQAQYLAYELYHDSAGTQRFGDAVTAQRLTGQSGLGATANTIPVYGAITTGQSAPVDTYADSVPITVYY